MATCAVSKAAHAPLFTLFTTQGTLDDFVKSYPGYLDEIEQRRIALLLEAPQVSILLTIANSIENAWIALAKIMLNTYFVPDAFLMNLHHRENTKVLTVAMLMARLIERRHDRNCVVLAEYCTKETDREIMQFYPQVFIEKRYDSVNDEYVDCTVTASTYAGIFLATGAAYERNICGLNNVPRFSSTANLIPAGVLHGRSRKGDWPCRGELDVLYAQNVNCFRKKPGCQLVLWGNLRANSKQYTRLVDYHRRLKAGLEREYPDIILRRFA
jgi:hypothetical protein